MEPLGMYDQTVLLGDGLHGLLVVFSAFVAGCFALLFVRSWVDQSRADRVGCPRDGRRARVLFRVGRDGEPEDVDRCSLHVGDECGKECLQAAH